MQAKATKTTNANDKKSQKRPLQQSLKKLLGNGLLNASQRSEHQINPYLLRDALGSRALK